MKAKYFFNFENGYYDKNNKQTSNEFNIITSKTGRLCIDLFFNLSGTYSLELEIKSQLKKIKNKTIELEIINIQNDSKIFYYNLETQLIKNTNQLVFFRNINITHIGKYYLLFNNLSLKEPIGIRNISLCYLQELPKDKLYSYKNRDIIKIETKGDYRQKQIACIVKYNQPDEFISGGYLLEFSVPKNPSETMYGLDFQYGYLIINQSSKTIKFGLYDGNYSQIKYTIKPNRKYNLFIRIQHNTFFTAYIYQKHLCIINYKKIGTCSIPFFVNKCNLKVLLGSVGFSNGHLYNRSIKLYQIGVISDDGKYMYQSNIELENVDKSYNIIWKNKKYNFDKVKNPFTKYENIDVNNNNDNNLSIDILEMIDNKHDKETQININNILDYKIDKYKIDFLDQIYDDSQVKFLDNVDSERDLI